jgi:hypothetical protein
MQVRKACCRWRGLRSPHDRSSDPASRYRAACRNSRSLRIDLSSAKTANKNPKIWLKRRSDRRMALTSHFPFQRAFLGFVRFILFPS